MRCLRCHWHWQLLLAVALRHATALDNGLGQKPQLGYNSWNALATNVTEAALMTTIDLFVSLGLKDVGYQYVSVDDGWSKAGRTANGSVAADPVAFPGGMKKLADHAHANGLLFGLYSSNSLRVCGVAPGGLGNEQQDANTFASWGIGESCASRVCCQRVH